MAYKLNYLWRFFVMSFSLALGLVFLVQWWQMPPVSANERLVLPTATPDLAATPAEGEIAVRRLNVAPTPTPRIHVVQAGENPGSIAVQYGLTADELMQANRISDPTSLQIGQNLSVPATGAAIAGAVGNQPRRYIVQAGDIPLTIAQRYGLTAEALLQANGISDPTSLQIGQELVIPASDSPAAVLAAAQSDLGERKAAKQSPSTTHQVEAGDTFLTLAARYGSSVEAITAANPTADSTRLQIGETLVIPITGEPFTLRNSGWQPGPDPAEVVSAPYQGNLESQLFESINAQRTSRGLPAYTPDPLLNQTARSHAEDMVRRGYFSHVTPEGATLDARLAAAGFDPYWSGENIQRNTRPADQTVNYALTWFMNSRVHRSNILHNHYTHLGVGVVEGPPGWYTLVLNFAAQ